MDNGRKKPGEVWLNVGCGIKLLSDFINVDKFLRYEDLIRADGIYCNAEVQDGAEFVQADAGALPFPDNYADYILSDCMIEHLSHAEVLPTLTEWRRVLKPYGELVIITTDFTELANLWLSHIAANQEHNEELYVKLSEVIYGNQVGEGEFHRWPFTPTYLKMCLLRTGWPFFSISVIPTNGEMAQIKGYPRSEPAFVLTSMLIARAHKTAPPGVEDNPAVIKIDLDKELS